MALVPLDVLTKHGIDPDKAITIWEELKEKFDFRPVEHRNSHEVDISIRVSGNPMLWYFGTDQRAYRMDDQNYHGETLPEHREAQIALALTDISARRLRDVTV